MNSLPGTRARSEPVGLGGIVGCEQQQDFGLQRVGVLEFVDEDMGEALLQLGAHGGVVAHEVARGQQQIEKIEAAGALLQFT